MNLARRAARGPRGQSSRLWGSVGWQTEPWQPAPVETEHCGFVLQKARPPSAGPLPPGARGHSAPKPRAPQSPRWAAPQTQRWSGPRDRPSDSEQTAKVTTVLELIPVPCTAATLLHSHRIFQTPRATICKNLPSLQKQLPSAAGPFAAVPVDPTTKPGGRPMPMWLSEGEACNRNQRAS